MYRLTDLKDIESFIKGHQLTFLYISQHSCGVCQALLPRVERLLKSFPEIKSAFVDIADAPGLASSLSIFTVPVLLLFIDGKEVIRNARFINMNDLEYNIEKYYNLLLGD